MLDNGEITFPGNTETKEFSTTINPDFNVLKTELESFTYDLSPSGLIHYGAPEGLHDDCVVALALAAFMIKQRKFYAPLSAFRFGSQIICVVEGKPFSSLRSLVGHLLKRVT